MSIGGGIVTILAVWLGAGALVAYGFHRMKQLGKAQVDGVVRIETAGIDTEYAALCEKEEEEEDR